MLYKVGDIVKVKENLVVGEHYRMKSDDKKINRVQFAFVEKMDDMKGKKFRIKEVKEKRISDPYYVYKLETLYGEEVCFSWCDEMLDPANEAFCVGGLI